MPSLSLPVQNRLLGGIKYYAGGNVPISNKIELHSTLKDEGIANQKLRQPVAEVYPPPQTIMWVVYP